jgi:hypothetical protein
MLGKRLSGALTSAFAIAFLATSPNIAQASTVIDQSNPNSGLGVIAAFYQTDLAQSFTAGASNTAGAGILLDPINFGGSATTSTINIQLWTALPITLGATELASGSVIGSLGTYADVFWSPVTTTVGTQYYLLFYSTEQYFAIDGSVNNYPGGNVFANGGYSNFTSFDYAFRTYTDTSFSSATPLPAALPLFASGLGALGLLGWRRKRKNAAAIAA